MTAPKSWFVQQLLARSKHSRAGRWSVRNDKLSGRGRKRRCWTPQPRVVEMTEEGDTCSNYHQLQREWTPQLTASLVSFNQRDRYPTGRKHLFCTVSKSKSAIKSIGDKERLRIISHRTPAVRITSRPSGLTTILPIPRQLQLISES